MLNRRGFVKLLLGAVAGMFAGKAGGAAMREWEETEEWSPRWETGNLWAVAEGLSFEAVRAARAKFEEQTRDVPLSLQLTGGLVYPPDLFETQSGDHPLDIWMTEAIRAEKKLPLMMEQALYHLERWPWPQGSRQEETP